MKKNYKKIGIVFGLMFIVIALSNPLIPTFHTEAGLIPDGTHSGHCHPKPNLMPYLQPGDIIFMDPCPPCNGDGDIIQNKPEGINSNDHCVIFVGTITGSLYDDWCIHAGTLVKYTRLYGDGTKYGENPPFVPRKVNFSIFRVKTANTTQRNDAIIWADGHRGDGH